jgi:hypothetical protein
MDDITVSVLEFPDLVDGRSGDAVNFLLVGVCLRHVDGDKGAQETWVRSGSNWVGVEGGLGSSSGWW